MKHSSLYQAVLLGTSLISAASVAQENNTLDTVIVSATRSAQSENLAPTMISVISNEQIIRSGATSLSEVLRSSGAVQVKDTLGDGNRISVTLRGFGQNSASNVLVLIDGRRLNNPTLSAPNLNAIALQDIERIEITQGSAGTLYGDKAVGGVVNIITQKGNATTGNIEYSIGSYSNESLQANISHHYDNGLGVRLSGKTSQADNYRENNDSEFETYTAELNYQHDNGELFIEKQKVDDDLYLPGALTDSQLNDDRQQSFKNGQYSNRNTEVIRLGIDQYLTENLTLLAEYSERETHSNNMYSSASFQDTEVTSFTPRLTGEWEQDNGTLHLTGGYDQIKSEYQASWGSDYSQQIEAYYLQTIIPLREKLSLTLGSRYSRVNDRNNSTNKVFKDSVTAKEIGLTYQLNEEQRLFIRRDENFRFATLDEHGFTALGLDHLEPQTGSSLEMGWQHDDQTSHYAATIYRLDLKNELMYDPTVTNIFSGTGANINLDDSRRQGIILELSRDLTDNLQLGTTYTYTNSELTSGSFKGNEVPYVAMHTLNVFGDYQIDSEWSLFVDGQYTGDRYQDDDNANDQRKVPEQLILNTALNYNRDNWYGSLRVNNLSNEQYDGYTIYTSWAGSNHYPAPERNFKMTVGYRF